MKNIYSFFWFSFIVKVFVFTVLNYFFWDISSFDNKKIILYVIAVLLFAIVSFLKFRSAKKFGKYLTLTGSEFSFILISAMAFDDLGFATVALFVFIEWQLYLKEFCIIKPSDKFDGDAVTPE